MPRCPKCGHAWSDNPRAAKNLGDPAKAGAKGWTPERKAAWVAAMKARKAAIAAARESRKRS